MGNNVLYIGRIFSIQSEYAIIKANLRQLSLSKNKNMKNKALFLLLAAGFLAFGSQVAQADGPGGLPDEDDLFWNVMSDMTSPNDTANCVSSATAIFESEGMPVDEAAAEANTICNQLAQMDDEMTSGMSAEGVQTNLFSADNWHTVEGLYFHRVGYGKIEFSATIDFMSYDFMNFMENFRTAMEMNEGEIGLDSDLVEDFKALGATLTMYNVPEYNDPEILVDGEEDNEGIVSNFVYDQDTDTVTFTAAHFTTFTLSESADKAKVTSWEAYLYETKSAHCPVKLKLKLKGRRFDRGVDVRIGGKEAHEVNRESTKKMTAKFCYKKLTDVKTKSERKVRVTNPDADAEVAEKRINITGVAYKFRAGDFDTMTSTGIRNVQTALNQLGLLDGGRITGRYGMSTEQAIKTFQGRHNIPQTGYVGPLTRKALEREQEY